MSPANVSTEIRGSAVRRSQLFMLVLGASILVGSALPAAGTGSGADFAKAVEAAHGGEAWNSRAALAAEIEVEFGGNTLIQGQMITDTPVGQTRFELEDGTVLVFDGEMAWTSPADSAFQGTRFHVLTWPYFLAAAMKLDDPGTHLKSLGQKPFRGEEKLDAALLTFGENVGDSPEDWYVVYRDSKDRLAGMAYIVTFGKSAEEAEKEPHAILYHDYREVDGTWLSTRWSFWNWSEEKGVFGEPIGHVKLGNIRFVEPPSEAFAEPVDARPEPAPGS